MNIELGKYNRLRVVKFVDFGLYLDGGDDGEILLPQRYVPEGVKEGDELEVFLYLDNEERLIATTQTPLIQVGEFACLEVNWVNRYGAFMNWGLMKDLFVPFREQKARMEQGKKYVVYAYQDEESFRLAASAKVEKFLSKDMPDYEPGQQVEVLIWQKTDLGFKVIVENKFAAMLFKSEVFTPLSAGMKLKAYVKQVRADGKIDLMLQLPGPKKVDDFAESLLKYIRGNGGYTSLHDKSDAREIYEVFGVSKKTFKKAVGELYKMRLIQLHPDGISLSTEE